MGWVTGGPRDSFCPVCGAPTKTSFIPQDRRDLRPVQMRWCEQDRLGWAVDEDERIDYRLYKIRGHWRAKPL